MKFFIFLTLLSLSYAVEYETKPLLGQASISWSEIELVDQTETETKTDTEVNKENESLEYDKLLKLEQLPEINRECNEFLSKDLENFKLKGIIKVPLRKYFKALKKIVRKAESNAHEIENIGSDFITSWLSRTTFGKNYNFVDNKYYKEEASKCYHRLKTANKLIQKRIESVANLELKEELLEIQTDLINAMSSVGSVAQTVILETDKYGQIHFNTLETPEDWNQLKPLFTAFSKNGYIYSIGNSIKKIDQLIDRGCLSGLCL